MNLKKYIGRLSLLALWASLAVACSKTDDQRSLGEVPAEQAQETISLEGTIEDFPEEIRAEIAEQQETQARLGFQDNGRGNGMSFVFEPREQFWLHTYWQQGNTKAVGQLVRLTVYNNPSDKRPEGKGRRWEAKATLIVPNAINRNLAEPIYISGAIGVAGIELNGKATVFRSGAMFQQYRDRKYLVPMYFPRTKLEKGGESRIFPDLQAYGSYLAIQLKNANDEAYYPQELSFKTAGFSTEGKMDLSKDGYPTWETSQTKDTEQIVRIIKQGDVPPKGNKTFFVWVKPRIKTGFAKLHTEIRSHLSEEDNPIYNRPQGAPNDYYGLQDLGGTSQSEIEFPDQKMAPMQEGKVYRLTEVQAPKPGGLIITEVFMGKDADDVGWELFNSSNKDIDLSEYMIARGAGNSNLPATMRSLIDPDDVLLQNRTQGYYIPVVGVGQIVRNIRPVGSKIQKAGSVNKGKYVLKPKEFALFIGAGVFYESPLMRKRTMVKYAFGLSRTSLSNGDTPYYDTQQGGWWAIVKGNSFTEAGVEDVFFRTRSGIGGVNLNLDATYMRKPYRDVPRKYMEVDGKDPSKSRENTDWVIRPRSENTDWGYRFGFGWDGATLERNNPKFLGERNGDGRFVHTLVVAGYNGYYNIKPTLPTHHSENRPLLYFTRAHWGKQLKNGRPKDWEGMQYYYPPRSWRYTHSVPSADYWLYPNNGWIQAY